MHKLHYPKPQLLFITPIPENAPFSEQSVKDAFNIYVTNPDDILEYNLLKINWDLNMGLFTWNFDTHFHSSLILVFTARGQFFNEDINESIMQWSLESIFNEAEFVGEGTWDYTYNGTSLVVTIKHEY